MKRYLAAIGAVALVLAACSSSSDAAATVNGTDITADQVEGLVYDTGEDFGDAQFTQLLDILVQWNAVTDAAKDDFDIEASTDEIDTETERLYAEQGQGLTFEEYLEQQNISEEGLDLYAEQLIIGSAILDELSASVTEPTEDEAEQLLAENPRAFTQVCAAHILVATQEEADALIVRLDGGEDFAALAVEASIDGGSGSVGGDLGCTAPSTYVPEFAEASMTAAIGEITDPVQSEFGFHLIRVDSRSEASMEELLAAAAERALADAVDDWYRTSISAADVTVAETYGTWETDPDPGIVPPPA